MPAPEAANLRRDLLPLAARDRRAILRALRPDERAAVETLLRAEPESRRAPTEASRPDPFEAYSPWLAATIRAAVASAEPGPLAPATRRLLLELADKNAPSGKEAPARQRQEGAGRSLLGALGALLRSRAARR